MKAEAVDTDAKRGRKRKFEEDAPPPKKGNASDSALEYSDGNFEFEQALNDGRINDDSGQENVEGVEQDIMMDLPSEEEEAPSDFDKESKASKII